VQRIQCKLTGASHERCGAGVCRGCDQRRASCCCRRG
jgi:hypothetical protein